MAKNSKPLYYLIDKSLLDTPEMQERIRKGHRVEVMPETWAEVDIILGPQCYRINAETVKLVDFAEKSKRAEKYPAKGKVKDGSVSVAEAQAEA